MSVEVKICGITRVEDALMAQRAGADALGLVMYPKSSRYVDLQQAIALRQVIAPDTLCVVLLVNADKALVEKVIDEVKPDLIQFHGDETAAFCRQFDFPYIRALRMHDDLDIEVESSAYRDAYGLLFDAWNPDQYGGTGEQFDWQRGRRASGTFAWILAGGLIPLMSPTPSIQHSRIWWMSAVVLKVPPGLRTRQKFVHLSTAPRGLIDPKNVMPMF